MKIRIRPERRLLRALCIVASILFTGAISTADIPWRGQFEDALKSAATSKQVIFLAVNMDGERANDRMVKEVYRDKRIQELAGHTLNLVASNDSHAKDGKTCPRFKHVTCKEHRRTDVDVRDTVLTPNKEGYVVAPQHVFLAPDGSVILSVPFGIAASELEWCFVSALRTVDPDFEFELSSAARAPKRLIMGGVHKVGATPDALPLTREDALELISEVKKGLLRGEERERAHRRLATADEEEARKFILGVLRTVPRGAGSGGGRGGGGGGVGGDTDGDQSRRDRRPALMHWIGVASPPSYWEVCAEFLDENVLALRKEAIVALEQLAARESLKVLTSHVRKEKDLSIKKNILRAIGAAGRDDKGARKLLLKQSNDDRELLLQLNAIIALGSLSPHEDVAEFLNETLNKGEGELQIAAVLAMGFTRDVVWLESLKEVLEEGGVDTALKDAIKTTIATLEGGALAGLEGTLMQIARDEIFRERVLGTGGGRQ